MADGADDRLLGGLYGLLVGDAVGVPYEFHSPATLPDWDAIEIVPPAGFRRAHVRAPKCAWSDDGAQALCLLDSLLTCGTLDVDDLGQRFLRWCDTGYLAVDGIVFDIGIQTSEALAALRAGVPAHQAGPTEARRNGNGSLMRVLPLALWHSGDDAALVRDAALQSRVTHGHPRSQLCCALYCLWARATLRESADPWRTATASLRSFCANNPTWSSELEEQIRPDSVPEGRGSGYVVDCLHSARLALLEASYERVIRRAISLGNDTDTTAAVAGGIAGLRHGLSGIPSRWLEALTRRELVEPLASNLQAHSRERM
jgi:ADP-ribosylglycohydrolase